ncbi:MAG TPA: tRNA (adenosine(37)-N6)-threonylcarbamoyltransferase complex dimerization subunit type 1 TsaB [Pseudonocardiaceae bacterium]|nr:tRNA (adenosine(37)-N6)-threonylcarbamoyltransferase complex dimerization subunit type 1 TsaB [Pseudonocardiaceae bacterium]
MIVLALDTATPAITAGIVTLSGGLPRTLAQRVTVNARAHGELLTPQIQQALAAAGLRLADLTAIVVGAGPGPFTGLRVGMVTAAAFADALGLPVHPVCTLDAIAADVLAADLVATDVTTDVATDVASDKDTAESFVVCTDARRREVYWAVYDATGLRVEGPSVHRPADLPDRLAELGVRRAAGEGATQYAEVLGLPTVEPSYPSARGLVAVAAEVLRTGATPDPLTPLYLRRPDATEAAPRKQVSRL